MPPLPPDAIVITALGMDSPLGGVVTACAAARAGLSRAREIDDVAILRRDGSDLEIHGHSVITAAGFKGLGKLACLASAALGDLLGHDSMEALDPAYVGLALCLPDLAARGQRGAGEAQSPRASYGRDLCARLSEACSLAIPQENWMAVERGHAGIGFMLEAALTKLASGRWRQCLIGGVDSLIEEPAIEWLYAAGRLKSSERPDGLAPGEAGAFFLLERFDAASRRGAKVLARLGRVATGIERGDGQGGGGASGEGLAAAISQVLASAAGQDRAFILSDHNGEHHRSAELANVRIRLSRSHRWIPWAAIEYPAMSFGDTGAASGAIGVCMAVRAIMGGYGQGSAALILSSSDDGSRAALRVQRAEDP